MNYSITSLICGVICYEKCAYLCFSVCLCRWVHAVCESLYTEDEVEQASDEGFACTSCTPYVPKPVGKSENDTILKLKTRILWFQKYTQYTHCTDDMIFFCFLYLLFAFVRSSRVSHYGFNKDQRARLVDFAY